MDSDETRESLRGLEGIAVLIETISDIHLHDFNELLQKDIETELRKFGIRVLSLQKLYERSFGAIINHKIVFLWDFIWASRGYRAQGP